MDFVSGLLGEWLCFGEVSERLAGMGVGRCNMMLDLETQVECEKVKAIKCPYLKQQLTFI